MHRYKRRLLALTVGSDRVASSRVRAGTVIEFAGKHGWATQRIQADSRLWPIRLILSLAISPPDILLLQKMVLPRTLNRLLTLLSKEIVLELDDAIYLGYPGASGTADRMMKRTRQTLVIVDRLIVSNQLIADDLAPYFHADISVFPGPAPVVSSHENPLEIREKILWLGSPSTIENLRELVYPAAKGLPSFEFTVVGAPMRAMPFPNVEEIVWDEEAQRRSLRTARLGLMPLLRSAWNDRKASYKVLEYLAHDVIPIGQATDAMIDLLGPELEALMVVVDNQERESWMGAIDASQNLSVDDAWRAARDRVFDSLCVEAYSMKILGCAIERRT